MRLEKIVAKVSACALGNPGIFIECMGNDNDNQKHLTVGSVYKVIERYKDLICIKDDRGRLWDLSPHLFRKINQ